MAATCGVTVPGIVVSYRQATLALFSIVLFCCFCLLGRSLTAIAVSFFPRFDAKVYIALEHSRGTSGQIP